MLIRNNNVFRAQSLDRQALMKLMNIGERPDLTDEETEAILGHRKGPQTHLLSENCVIHEYGVKQTIIITKNIHDGFDVADFVTQVMNACQFNYWMQIGIV